MKIVICGSMSSSKKMLETAGELEKNGHSIVLPQNVHKYAQRDVALKTNSESIAHKIKDNLIRDYFQKIDEADAVLLVNEDKNNIKGYIGGNAFLEAGFAHVLGRKIYILHDIPKMIYTDELLAMQPLVLNNDLSKIN